MEEIVGDHLKGVCGSMVESRNIWVWERPPWLSRGHRSRKRRQTPDCKDRVTPKGFAPDNFRYRVLCLPLVGLKRDQGPA